MPEWILKLARDWAFNKGTFWAAARCKEDPALISALIRLKAGGSFLQVVQSYTATTENKEDDAVAAGIEEFRKALETQPFRELLQRYLGAVKVPDFDTDPSNDISVFELLERIVNQAVNEEK